MAELSTIARPYARAAFASASAAGQLPAWDDALAAAVAVVDDSRVASLIGNPHVQSGELVDFVASIAGTGTQGKLQAELHNFLQLLAHNRRLALLPQIAQQFGMLRAQAENVADVEVLSARALTAAQAQQLQAALERRLGRTVRLHPQVDTTLIGGALVRYGDLVIDGSLRGRIERMGTALSGA